MQQSGSSVGPLLVGVGLVGLIGVGGYFAYRQLSSKQPTNQTAQSGPSNQSSNGGQASQVSNWPSTAFKVVNASDATLGLDVPRDSGERGLNLILFKLHGGDNQRFTYDGTSKHILTNKGLAVSAEDGKLVQHDPVLSDTNQRWEYDESTGEIRLEGTNTCMDAAGGVKDGTKMLAYECNGGDNQRWQIESI